TAAFLTGREAESVDTLSRAHHEFMNRGDAEAAARCGMRIGLRMVMNGEIPRGAGWLARARRVLDDSGRGECAVHGYLLIPVAVRAIMEGDGETGVAAVVGAVAICQRFGDIDLVLLARHGQGRVLVRTGRLAEGLALFDEVMVGVAAGGAAGPGVGGGYCRG